MTPCNVVACCFASRCKPAAVYNNLAKVYERRQAYDQAEHMLDLARRIRRNQLEAGHELRILSALRLAMFLDEQGRSTEATAYYQEAREQDCKRGKTGEYRSDRC